MVKKARRMTLVPQVDGHASRRDLIRSLLRLALGEGEKFTLPENGYGDKGALEGDVWVDLDFEKSWGYSQRPRRIRGLVFEISDPTNYKHTYRRVMVNKEGTIDLDSVVERVKELREITAGYPAKVRAKEEARAVRSATSKRADEISEEFGVSFIFTDTTSPTKFRLNVDYLSEEEVRAAAAAIAAVRGTK